MQLASIESTRSIPESISPDLFCGGFNTSGFCCDVDKPMADSASLMLPSIDRETRSTPPSSSELLIFGRLSDLRQVKYFPRVTEKWGFSELEFVSNSTEPRVRVRVDTFSRLSESSSGRTFFSSRSADSRMSASWEMVFGLGEIVVTRWLEKPPDQKRRLCPLERC